MLDITSSTREAPAQYFNEDEMAEVITRCRRLGRTLNGGVDLLNLMSCFLLFRSHSSLMARLIRNRETGTELAWNV